MQVLGAKMPSCWKLAIDGASRANPGKSGVGIYITKNGNEFEKFGFYTGIKTNNQAEYLALIIGLLCLNSYAKSEDMIVIISDSELMVRQVKGQYRVRNEGLQPLFTYAMQLLKGLKVTVAHVPREYNSQADKLANLGIDKNVHVPDAILAMLHDHAITV